MLVRLHENTDRTTVQHLLKCNWSHRQLFGRLQRLRQKETVSWTQHGGGNRTYGTPCRLLLVISKSVL